MNTILDPIGGRPPTVYWRRRAILLVAFAVGVLLLARACGSGGPQLAETAQQQPVPLVSTFTPTPKPTPTPAATVPALAIPAEAATAKVKTSKPTATVTVTAAPKPTSDAGASGPLSCAKSALAVKLRADQSSYGSKDKPKLYLGVRNTGKVGCLVNLGSKALSFTVVSGQDRIWSSDDCQGKGTGDIRLLKPGQMLWARSIWSKVRSLPGCPKGQSEARPGYYLLEGSAGGVKAKKREVFQLT